MNHKERITVVIKLNLKVQWNLCDCGDDYTHVKGSITLPNTRTAAAPNDRNEVVTCKTCAPFANCVREVNNTPVDDFNDTDVVMPADNRI